MRRKLFATLTLLLGYAVTNTTMAAGPTQPTIDGHVVMLYYDDLEAASTFYRDRLGLKEDLKWEWVRFYRIGPDAHVGLVKSGEGHHQAQETNAVMLSLVTSNIDDWYAKLSSNKDIEFIKAVDDRGPIRSFMIADPGGYTVEYFQWLQKPATL